MHLEGLVVERFVLVDVVSGVLEGVDLGSNPLLIGNVEVIAWNDLTCSACEGIGEQLFAFAGHLPF